jgi:dehydrogenase/reductase SDR family member 12
VRAFADRRRDEDAPIDAIVHNAGALFAEKAMTGDGLERTYQVHVVAPFLLTTLLLPTLAAGRPDPRRHRDLRGMYAEKLVTARVDSPGGYRGTVAYARAKRAQVTLTHEWQRRFGTAGSTSTSCTRAGR